MGVSLIPKTRLPPRLRLQRQADGVLNHISIFHGTVTFRFHNVVTKPKRVCDAIDTIILEGSLLTQATGFDPAFQGALFFVLPNSYPHVSLRLG